MGLFGKSKKEKSEDLQYQADLAATADRDAEAERLYRQALELDPQNVVAWNNLGCLLGSLNRHQEARDCFDKAVTYKHDYCQAWQGLAVSEKNLKHYDMALKICDMLEEDYGWSMTAVREDTIRRRDQGIEPPSGNPYDSSTPFAQQNAKDDLSQSPDWPFKPYSAETMFNTAKMMAGLLPDAAMPTMQELARRGYKPAVDWMKTNT